MVELALEVEHPCFLVDFRDQQFTVTFEVLARQNVELQNELAKSRQPAANELCSTHTGSPRCSAAWDAGDETGAQCSRCTLAQRYHVCRS